LSAEQVPAVTEEAPRILRADRLQGPADGLHEPTRVRALAFLSSAFIFEKASSMGEKSGE
jgi:hypothetical protein